MLKGYRLTVCLIVLYSYVFGGQKFTISGHVYDFETGEPLIGVVVYSEDYLYSTATNLSGFYSVTLEEGLYNLVFSYTGYVTKSVKVYLQNNQKLNLSLNRELEQLDEVLISDTLKKSKESEIIGMSSLNLPINQIQNIKILGESDPLKILQMTPGVQSGGEATPGLFVRGSNAEHNLFILDDATYYNPFHLFGVYSVINADALSNFEIIKGGFPARYGGRLASVVDINMKEGNKKEFEGKATIGLLASKLFVESPIDEKTSFFVSGRGAYGQLLARPLIEDLNDMNLFFYDFNTKFTHQINTKNKLFFGGGYNRDVFGLYNFEESDFKMNVNWQNLASTLRLHTVVNNKLFMNNSFIYSDFKLNNNIWNRVPRYNQTETSDFYDLVYASQIQDYSFKSDFTYYKSQKHTIRFGAVSTMHRFNPSATILKNTFVSDNNQNSNRLVALESAIYIEDEFKFGNKISGNIGVRVSSFLSEGYNALNPEPRALIKYQINKKSALKTSYAKMNQYIHLLTTRNIGFPTDLWVPSKENVPNQSSSQYAFAYVYDFTKINSYISIEGYYKRMDNISSFKEGTTFMQNVFLEDINPNDLKWEDNLTFGVGEAYGMELMFHRKKGKLNGWVSYTLSWSKSKFENLNLGRTFYNRQDRRHQINFVGVYNITKRWKANMSWVFQTGNPITVANGVVSGNSTMELPEISNNVNTNSQPALFYYSGINNFRMPNYHRLDFSISYSFKKQASGSDIELGIYNVYNRENVFFYQITSTYDDTSVDQVTILPFMPFINYTFSF